MSKEREQLTPPNPLRPFAFWGDSAQLVLPEGGAEVLFDYLTEPPHGDPLYQVRVNSVALGGWKTPLPCFGRSLHVSPCRTLLALTALRGSCSSFHVVDLVTEQLWSHAGFVEIARLEDRSIYVSHPTWDGKNMQPGPMLAISLDDKPWHPLHGPIP